MFESYSIIRPLGLPTLKEVIFEFSAPLHIQDRVFLFLKKDTANGSWWLVDNEDQGMQISPQNEEYRNMCESAMAFLRGES